MPASEDRIASARCDALSALLARAALVKYRGQTRARADDRIVQGVGPATKFSRDECQIGQQQPRRQSRRGIPVRAAKDVCESADPREQELELHVRALRWTLLAGQWQTDAFEADREIIGWRHGVRHQAILRCFGETVGLAGHGRFTCMKAVLKRLIAAFGLAPARHVARLADEASKAAHRARKTEERLTKVRTDADGWKRRHEGAVATLAEWKQAAADAEMRAKRATADLERAVGDGERLQAKIGELRARVHTSGEEIQDLRARLQETRRRTSGAHEQLMAMEVKLDLLEAAIRILDTRTRAGAEPAPAETPVARSAPPARVQP